MRASPAIAVLLATAAAGCSSAPPDPGAASHPMPHCPSTLTETISDGNGDSKSVTRTASAIEVAGSGVARDEAPPQRRFRLILRGGPAPFRMRVVEESNATALPPAPGADTRIPEPPPVEKRPDMNAPPPVIPIPAPR